MKRTVAVAVGAGALAAACVWLGPVAEAGQDRSAGKDVVVHVQKDDSAPADREDGRRKVERRIVVGHAGGGFLGIGLEELEGDARGAKVRSVESGSPAEKAGLKEGDVIVRFDGEPVRSAAQLSRLVGETPAGRSVAMEATRGGATQKLNVTLGERRTRIFDGEDFPGMKQFRFELPEPPEAPEPPEPPHVGATPHVAPLPPGTPRRPHAFRFDDDGDVLMNVLPGLGGPRKLGLEYIDMGEQLAAAYKLPDKGGVLVTSVDSDGPAGKAGIKAGDVILKFDGKAIKDGRDLREAVSAAEGGKDVAISVQRDGRPLDVKATLAKPETQQRRRSRGTML